MLDKDCIFCKIIRGEIPSEKVYEDEAVLLIRDIKPEAPVHLLAIPKEHYVGVHDVPPDRMNVVTKIFQAVSKVVVERKLAGPGYRVVLNSGAAAGQLVPHIHLHILSGRPLGWPPG
jgi:histidine triad (HIT) family protein